MTSGLASDNLEQEPATSPSPGRPLRVAVIVVLIGCLTTAGLFWKAQETALRAFRRDFEAAAAIRAQLVRDKLGEALLVTLGVQRSHATSGSMTGPQFSSFCAPFVNSTHGLRALSWVSVVSNARRAAFEESARRENGPSFELREFGEGERPVRAGERPFYFPVSFVEPSNDDTLAALGFDLGSVPGRRAALERARDSGLPTASERVRLADRTSGNGALLFVPVYRKNAATGSTEERRSALEAFAVAVLRPDILFDDALSDTVPLGLPCDLLDLSGPPEGRLLGRWRARLTENGSWKARLLPQQVTSLQRFSFAGREWALDVHAGPGYLARNYPLGYWLLLPSGSLASLLLGFFFYHVLSRRDEALATARVLEAEVAARRRIEGALRTSEERYRMVADNTCDWVFWLSPEGAFRYLSPSCEAVTGYPPQAFETDPSLFYRIIHPQDAAVFSRHREVAEAGQTSAPLEFRIVRADGRERWIEHRCRPVLDGSGQNLGTRGSNRDITDRKVVEGQLRQAQKLESLGALAGGVAHQLNNILMGILGNTELVLKKLPDGFPARSRAEAAVESVLRAAELVRGLLVFGGHELAAHARVSLSELAAGVARSLESELPEGCSLDVDLPADVPVVMGDGDQLRQALIHLVRNAFEAIKGNAGAVTLRVGRKRIAENDAPEVCTDRNLSPGDYAVVEVADTGGGIAPENMASIFDPFFTTKVAGQGLGLSVVRGFVRNHEGAIQVASQPGQGTSIRLFLPAA